MPNWLRALGAGLLLAACTSPSAEELLEGKACSNDDHRCADGYTCDQTNTCVPVSSSAVGGADSGGNPGTPPTEDAGASGARMHGGEAGLVAVATGGDAGAGAEPETGGDAGSTAASTGGIDETGGALTGGTGGTATGGLSGAATGGTGGSSTGGTAGTGGRVSCAGPAVDCAALEAALLHRYAFEVGPGAVDSVGGANGTLERGATLTGDGAVALAGSAFVPGGYVDLPNGIVSELTDATFEVWVNWNGTGSDWQRIFDFGDAMSTVGSVCVAGAASAPEDSSGACGRTYVTLYTSTDGTALAPPGVGFLTQPGIPGDDALRLESSTNLRANTTEHLAVVVDDAADRIAIYRNGDPDVSTTVTDRLAEINDINNWLGRSQFTDDPAFNGEILEFRIYGAAMSDSEIATSFAAGPDAEFLE